MKKSVWKSLSGLLFLFFSLMTPLLATPVITNLSTNHAPARTSGREITIFGTGFMGVPVVHFGSTRATVLSHTPTEIQVEVPEKVVSTVPISVTVKGETSLESAASYFAYRGDWIAYFGSAGTGRPFGVNTRTNEVITFPGSWQLAFSDNIAITPNGNKAYIALDNGSTSFTFVNLLNYPPPNYFGSPGGSPQRSMAIAPDGQTAYCMVGSAVFPILVKENIQETPIPLGSVNSSIDIAITPDGTTAYLVHTGPTVVVISLEERSVTTSIDLDASAIAAAIDPRGRVGYFAQANGTIACIRLADNTRLPDILVGTNAHTRALAINPNGDELYFTDDSGNFVIVDLRTHTVTERIPIRMEARGIAVTPDGKKAYVAALVQRQVFQVNLETKAVSTIFTRSGAPHNQESTRFVAITPDPAPIAFFTADIKPRGVATIFDASQSISPVGDIAEYVWDFGDGSPRGFGVNPSHIYAQGGTYEVTLTVTNTAGTSLSSIFTGKTMSRHGGSSARANMLVTISPFASPKLESISLNNGPEFGGSRVIIRGTNFAEGGLSVSVGGALAQDVVLISEEEILATTPPGTDQAEVKVHTAFGHSQEDIKFTYKPKALGGVPALTGLTPNVGPGFKHSTVTITGINFREPAIVFFGDAVATEVKVISPEMITALAPTLSSKSGVVHVVVTTGGGSSQESPASEYTYQSAPPNVPVVTAVLPSGGSAVGGSLLTIEGENFFGIPSVYFDGVPATDVNLIDATRILVSSPPGVGRVSVVVTTEGGGNSEISSGSRFTYSSSPPPAPRLDRLSPSEGEANGGTLVAIHGIHFSTSGGVQVYFGDALAERVNVRSNALIEAQAPSGVGSVSVRVTTRGGTSNSLLFTYISSSNFLPRIDMMLPHHPHKRINRPRIDHLRKHKKTPIISPVIAPHKGIFK